MILTIDEVNDLLDDMAEEFPAVLFDGLNGGVNLLEEAIAGPGVPGGGDVHPGGVLRRPAGPVYQPLLRLLCRPGGAGGLGPGDLARRSCKPPSPMS